MRQAHEIMDEVSCHNRENKKSRPAHSFGIAERAKSNAILFESNLLCLTIENVKLCVLMGFRRKQIG